MLRNLSGNNKNLTSASHFQKERTKPEAESVFKEITAKLDKLMKNKNLHIQEDVQLPKNKNPKQ